MPEFKIKNLMIDVVSAVEFPDIGVLCKYPTKLCEMLLSKCLKFVSFCANKSCGVASCATPSLVCQPCTALPTLVQCYQDCSFISPIWEQCPGGSLIGCPAGSEVLVIDIHKLVVNPELVKEVQVELDLVMKAVQERGVELNKAMAPQTKAQAEALEKELQAALEEVQRLKSALK